MNARKSKLFRRIARAMTTKQGDGYTPHNFRRADESIHIWTARCLPGTFKAQYRALKKAPNALAILKAAVAK